VVAEFLVAEAASGLAFHDGSLPNRYLKRSSKPMFH